MGLLLANVFMCHIENQLEQKSMIPSFYRRYVDDTLVTMPNTESATDFLQVLNSVHRSLSFTMELEHDCSIPFLGTVLTRCSGTLTTEVYRKPTDTAVIRVVTQRSSPLTAAHERDTFLSLKLTNKKQASIFWKPGPSPSPLLESKHGGSIFFFFKSV